MSIVISKNIPEGLQVDHLAEVYSYCEPHIRREGELLYIPVLVRKFTVGENSEFRYYDVPVRYTGQSLNDYGKCLLQSYQPLRAYFYGDWTVQNEQMLKGTFAQHQYAVRQLFPKYEGEVITAVYRFNEIYEMFWMTVDKACTEVGKTVADLPKKFNAEEMLAWAESSGMSAESIERYSQTFSMISLNLLQNGRNWDELFK